MTSTIPELRFEDGLWQGPMQLRMFARERGIGLSVAGTANRGPTEFQLAAVRAFMENTDKVIAAAESAVYDYYQRVAPEFRLMFDPASALRDVPEVTCPLGMGAVVTPRRLYVWDPDPAGRRVISLLLDCAWDIEQGVGLRFVNEELDIVGEQALVL